MVKQMQKRCKDELDFVALKLANEEVELKESKKSYLSEAEVKKKYGFK